MTTHGIKKMKYIKQGDDILGLTSLNEPEFSKVKLWFHRDVTVTNTYKTVETKDGTITSSLTHNIAIFDELDVVTYKHINNINENDLLVGLGESSVFSSEVINEYYSQRQGMYAPLTELSNYFVSDDGNTFYLAHSFAYIGNPLRYEKTIHKIFDAFEYVNPSVNDIDNDDNYVNPVAKFLHSSVLNVYEAPTIIRNKLYNLRRAATSGSSSRSSSSSNQDDDDIDFAPISVGINLIDFVMIFTNTHLFSSSEHEIIEYNMTNCTNHANHTE
jgi:hypothetical protein